MEGLVIVFLVLLKGEVAAILGIEMGVEFKEKTMLHGFRKEVKCWCGRLVKWEDGKDGRVMRWYGREGCRQESGEVGKVVGSWFYSRVGNTG